MPRKSADEAHSRFATLTRETIQHILNTRGWKQADAVARWKIPQTTLSEILSGKNAASTAALTPILEAEGWDPVSFFLHHPRLQRKHLEVSDGLIQKQYAEFIAAMGSDDRVQRILKSVRRVNKLGLRDEVAVVISDIITLIESAAAGRSSRKPPSRKPPSR